MGGRGAQSHLPLKHLHSHQVSRDPSEGTSLHPHYRLLPKDLTVLWPQGSWGNAGWQRGKNTGNTDLRDRDQLWHRLGGLGKMSHLL